MGRGGPPSLCPQIRPLPLIPILDLGVASLRDDAGELGGPAGVDLQPVRPAAVVLGAPSPVEEIVLVGTRLGWGQGWGHCGGGLVALRRVRGWG